jgi:hypothetical protein
VEDFIWSGYGRLTTLPPGMVQDDVMAVLNADKRLRELMMHALLKEQIISVSAYAPKAKVDYEKAQIAKDDSYWFKYKPKKESHAKVVISSEWKSEKDVYVDKETLEAYQRIAADIKSTIVKLQYHLTKPQ